jgi:hypothetical protein
MRAKMMALSRYQVVVAIMVSLVVILSAIGCGTSSLLSYHNSIQSTKQSYNEPRVNMFEWRFDLLNSSGQKAEQEDWDDDGPV